MSHNVKLFEARVKVKRKGSLHFSEHVGEHIENTVAKMFHIEARTQEQARKKAEKYGRPVSVRKVNKDKVGRSTENMLLRVSEGLFNPYPDAIAMDEMIWRRKERRAERINDRVKDKEGY